MRGALHWGARSSPIRRIEQIGCPGCHPEGSLLGLITHQQDQSGRAVSTVADLEEEVLWRSGLHSPSRTFLEA